MEPFHVDMLPGNPFKSSFLCHWNGRRSGHGMSLYQMDHVLDHGRCSTKLPLERVVMEWSGLVSFWNRCAVLEWCHSGTVLLRSMVTCCHSGIGCFSGTGMKYLQWFTYGVWFPLESFPSGMVTWSVSFGMVSTGVPLDAGMSGVFARGVHGLFMSVW